MHTKLILDLFAVNKYGKWLLFTVQKTGYNKHIPKQPKIESVRDESISLTKDNKLYLIQKIMTV